MGARKPYLLLHDIHAPVESRVGFILCCRDENQMEYIDSV